MNGLDAVAACLDSGVPNAVCHCWVEPLTRPNNLVGSAANCRPRVLTDVAAVLICASEAPNRRAALSKELKWRESDDPGVATLATASPSPVVEPGSDTTASIAAAARAKPRRKRIQTDYQRQPAGGDDRRAIQALRARGCHALLRAQRVRSIRPGGGEARDVIERARKLATASGCKSRPGSCQEAR